MPTIFEIVCVVIGVFIIFGVGFICGLQAGHTIAHTERDE